MSPKRPVTASLSETFKRRLLTASMSEQELNTVTNTDTIHRRETFSYHHLIDKFQAENNLFDYNCAE